MVLNRKRCALTVNEVRKISRIDKPTISTKALQKSVGCPLHSKVSKKTGDSAFSVMVKKKLAGSSSSTNIFLKSRMDSPNVSKKAMASAPKQSGGFEAPSSALKKKTTESAKINDRKKRQTKKRGSCRKRTNTRGERKGTKRASVKRKRKSGKKDKKKKKKKKKKEEEERDASEEEESEESDSDESIANGGVVCRNCSRGTVEQVDPGAAMHDLELPEIFSLEKIEE